jgi:phosphoribosylaminoimidazole-succinocarboxamide synthase
MTAVDVEPHVQLGEPIAEGKTKVLHAKPDDEQLVYMVHKDSITAGDGAKRDVLVDKGELSCRTTSAVYRLLESKGIATHYVSTATPRIMVVRRVEMIPIEWVARRLATGSYVRRTGTVEGTRFDDLLLEMFLKDDANHDPLITREEAVNQDICTPAEVEQALGATARIFEILEASWAEQEIQLVDLKVEYGRTSDGLLLADVIDNDSWRLWPQGKRELMLDKQVYRDLPESTESALASVRDRYVEVAERVERFNSGTTV